jgi:hypothetical protein
MDAQRRIHAARDRWSELTAAEAAALANTDWSAVNRCQQAKATLQTEIDELVNQLEAGARRQHPSALSLLSRELQALFAPLIEGERRNAATLEHLRVRARERRHELDRSQLNLRRLQQSYGWSRGCAWQSYS